MQLIEEQVQKCSRVFGDDVFIVDLDESSAAIERVSMFKDLGIIINL